VKRTSPKPSTTPTPLPKPNVEFAVSRDMGEMTPEKVRSLFCNPLYAGFGPFPALIDDETWVRAAAHAIREYGPEQFLVNMLYVLRKSYETLNTDPDES
jgi:hypothetical protein